MVERKACRGVSSVYKYQSGNNMFFERPTREKRELSVVDHGFCMPID
jgi:hypothetical protein